MKKKIKKKLNINQKIMAINQKIKKIKQKNKNFNEKKNFLTSNSKKNYKMITLIKKKTFKHKKKIKN